MIYKSRLRYEMIKEDGGGSGKDDSEPEMTEKRKTGVERAFLSPMVERG